jgi:inorganic triphosphatase YgiF
MHEVELKLQVPQDRRDALESALGVTRWQHLPLRAHYFDTADTLLAQHGFSLRLRKEGERWVQTLKGPGKHPMQRLEDEVDVAGGDETPAPDLARHRQGAAGKALATALGGKSSDGKPALQEQFSTQVDRYTQLMERGSTKVEVAYDHGAIHAGGKSTPVCELEVELKGGSPGMLCEMARPWVEAHGLWLSVVSKAQRGEQLAAGRAWGPVVKAGVPALDWSMTSQAMLQAVVASCLEQILPNAGEVALGSMEAEHVHQARVGLRRLRTALREIGDFAGDEELLDAKQLEVLATTFSRLGEIRDQETVSRVVQAKLQDAGAPPELHWPRPEQKLHSPDAAVQDTVFQTVLLDLLAFTLREPVPAKDCKKGKCGKALEKRLSKLHRQVEQDGERFTEISLEHQHRVRKRLKRLRYLSEFVTPLYGTHAVERYVQALRPAQDALGEHNDDVVGLDAYRRATAQQAQAWFAVGWLTAALRESARECQRALRKVADAPRFWKGGKKPG